MVASLGSYGDKRGSMAQAQIGKSSVGKETTVSGGHGTVVLATQ